MDVALYGPQGFYCGRSVPSQNFRTSAHVSPLWADAIASLALLVDAQLASPASMTVADIGAGGGELLAGLASRLPPRIRLIGVDVADRPIGLPDRIAWLPEPPTSIVGLLIAVELLDVVPLAIAEVDDDGLVRLVEVDEAGNERLGPALAGDDLEWLQRWWPACEPGDRAEIGLGRDAAWRSLAGRVSAGLAVAVDYSAVPERDVAGTLIGYVGGRACAPVPDGNCDITASVHFPSLLSPGDGVVSQREALTALGMTASRPFYDGDPQSYLQSLSRSGEAAELLDRGGLGGFSWLLHPVGIRSPILPYEV